MENFHSLAYKLAKPFLFWMDPERSHDCVLRLARFSPFLIKQMQIQRPVKILGLDFPNPVGLASGFDKDGEHLEVLSKLGFGFLEVGSVTPLAQIGNPKPRLHRLAEQQALLNHMGLNNRGVDNLVCNLASFKKSCIIGASFTKNTATPLNQALEDYVICLEKLQSWVDYLVADISCPNTSDFKANSQLDFLDNLSAGLKSKRDTRVPLLFKLSCDWDASLLEPLSQIFLRDGVDGVVCGNTSAGLSGRPLFPKALDLVRRMNQILQGRIPIIGAGGIFTHQDLLSMQAEGAQLFQIYTALVYRGPPVVSELLLGNAA